MIYADCGNTAVKLRHGDERVRLCADEVPAWLLRHPAKVLVLLPSASATAQIVRDAWPGTLREVGVHLHLPDRGQYPSMGLDRIVAGLAAGPGTIVVDAGTATTLTAWDGAGRFAGGLILPGPHAMIAGLCARAPALPLVEPLLHDAAAAQRDTRGAIAAGAGIGHAGMIVWCVAQLQRETGLDRVITTGAGAADLPLPSAVQRPWLVLDGLERLSAG